MTDRARGGRASEPLRLMQIAAEYVLLCAAAALMVADLWLAAWFLLLVALALAFARF